MSPLLRVTLAIDPRYVEAARASLGGQRGFLADVRRRAAALGLSPTLLETQDPTDPSVVTLLTRSLQPPAPGLQDDVLRIVRAERVAEPPGGTERASLETHPFDPGLSTAEVDMIRRALSSEHNPRHLWGLASCLDPSFPVAASLLRARKIAVESNHPPKAFAGSKPDVGAARRARVAVDHEARSRGIPREVADEDVRHAAYLEASGEAEPETPASLRAVARSLLRPVTEGVAIVDRDALLAVCPVRGDEGYVAPAAIQLALSTCKPEMAGVRSFTKAGERGDLLKNPPRGADMADTLRARMAMIRAQKAIERHRWLRWYERRRATSSPG
jgi:hypothetical protein